MHSLPQNLLAHRGKRDVILSCQCPSFGYPLNSMLIKNQQPPLIFQHLFKIADHQADIPWQPFHTGVDIHWLYRDGDYGPAAAVIRFQPGSSVPLHEHRGHEHILVLSGSQTDENGLLSAGSLMVHQPDTRHSVSSQEGCFVLAIYERRAQFLDAPKGLSNE